MARVIRAQLRPLAKGEAVIPAEVWDARGRARALLEQARADAAVLTEAAHAQGLAAGRAEAAAALFDVAALRERTLQGVESSLIELSLTLTAQLVRQTVEAQPDVMTRRLEPLLARVRRAERIVVRVHPQDVSALRAALPALHAQLELSGSVELEADAELQRGDCVVTSTLGDLDARVEVQILELARALRGDAP